MVREALPGVEEVEEVGEAATRPMTQMTVDLAPGGGGADVRQEEDEDHPMAEMMMAQEGVAAAQ